MRILPLLPLAVVLGGCQSVATEADSSAGAPTNLSMSLPHSIGPDSIQVDLAGVRVQGVGVTRSGNAVSVKIVPAPPIGSDTLRVGVWGLGMLYRAIGICMRDGKAVKVFDSTNAFAKLLANRVDSALKEDSSLEARDVFFDKLGEGLAAGDSSLRGWEVALPKGLTVPRCDSAALWHLVSHGRTWNRVHAVWLSTLDSASAASMLRGWLDGGRITKQQYDSVFASPAGPVVPVAPAKDTLPPEVTWIVPVNKIDTVVDTTRFYAVRARVVDPHLQFVRLNDSATSLEDDVLDVTVPLAEGANTWVVLKAGDSAGKTVRDSVRIFRKKAIAPRIDRVSPADGIDSVSDLRTSYTVSWKISDDDLDSVTIDGEPVLLKDGAASREVALKLGAEGIHVVRAVDRLRHSRIDTVRIFRAASVAPRIRRLHPDSSSLSVPDTQSFFSAKWSVTDSNLKTLLVQGKSASLDAGECGAKVFLAAGDTTRIAVWAEDELGSTATDTVKIWRPDSRTPFLAEIKAVQRGDSVVPLTDPVLPGVRFGRFEVTAGLYSKVMRLPAPQTPGLPVTDVNIYDAMLFCNALSKAAGLDTFYTYSARDGASGYLADFGVRSDTVDPKASAKVIRKGYRLPSSAEWDAAASTWGGDHPWGASDDSLVAAQYAVWNSKAARPVGSLHPTGGGIFDLAGNAAEWVYRNRGNVDELTNWVVRGGACDATTIQSMTRSDVWITGTTRNGGTGIRVVLLGQ